MIAQIETDVRSMAALTADSISSAPYYEFAVNHLISFYDAVGKYQMENVSSVVDPELSTILSAAYMRSLDASQNELWQRAGEIPSYYKSGLPIPAVIYYDSLVTHRLPYVPYI
jgi:hypothetical protein